MVIRPTVVWLLVLAAAATSNEASAQDRGAVVGLVAGAARTTQIWKPAQPNSSYTGLVLGAFAAAPIPGAGVSMLAEGSYTRRGGDVELDVAGVPALGRLRMDYMTIAVHVVLGRAFGPVRARVTLGPTLDQVIRSTLDPILSQVFDQEQTPVFAVAAGAGLDVWVTDRVRLGFDLRLTEGLSDAYDGDFTRVRNRSVEVLVRGGIPLALLRGS